MICELPRKCAFVKLHDAVCYAYELDSPPLVPGNVEPVYVGLRTEPPQLDIHLLGMLQVSTPGMVQVYCSQPRSFTIRNPQLYAGLSFKW